MNMQIYQIIKNTIKMLRGKILRRGKMSPLCVAFEGSEDLCAFLHLR